MIILSLRGGAEREMGAKCKRDGAHHSFQGVWSEAEDVFPKGRKVLETAPIFSTVGGGGKPKWGMKGADRGLPVAQD
jgi:hypothetical protein